MTRHFMEIIKGFIKENELQDLSGDGWSRMRQIEREIASGKIKTADEAVTRFLQERDFRYTIGKNRNVIKELIKKIEK